MMVVRILTSSLQGLDAQLITVEIDLASGIPEWRIVGLPDAMVNESKDRLRSAIRNAGFEFPTKKVIMNLAPASVRKEGTGFDVPIALSVLIAGEKISFPEAHWLEKTLWLGEVSLEGELRPVRGVLSVVILAKQLGFEAVVVPPENANEAALLEGVKIYSLPNLAHLPALFKTPEAFQIQQNVGQLLADAQATMKQATIVDFADVKGQSQAKRAL
jgi:magnesium chelatase family protein